VSLRRVVGEARDGPSEELFDEKSLDFAKVLVEKGKPTENLFSECI